MTAPAQSRDGMTHAWGGYGLLFGAAQGQTLGLDTRQKNPISNFSSTEPTTAGILLLADDVRRRFPRAIHRPTRPTDRYNCHGLTFAARRTGICDPSEVEKIIREDDYKVVSVQDVCAGEIAIYRSAVEVIHSGIVAMIRDGVPWILSKWGKLHEVVHQVHDCDYKDPVTYYRIDE